MKKYLDFEEICHLEKELYDLWKAIEKDNYGVARGKASMCWMFIHTTRINIPPSDNRSTTDTDLRARATRFLYDLLNQLEWRTKKCHEEGYECEYVYPYGFVPEGGCPRHD